MSQIDRILSAIESGRILGNATFPDDIDKTLDLRDTDPFDKEWSRVNDLLSSFGPVNDDTNQISRLCEAAFKKTYEHTENSELAGYVADDFGLIGTALVLDVDDPWLNGLWIAYREGYFPHRDIPILSGRLTDLLI